MISTLMLVLALAAPDDPPAAARGMVVDANGGPVAGVEILVSADYAGLHDPRPVLAKATSDETGHFRFARPAGDKFPSLRSATLWALKPAVGVAAVMYKVYDDTAFYRVVLDPQPAQVVDVVGPDKSPMSGDRITIRTMSMPSERRATRNAILPDELAERLAATTDASGKAELLPLASGHSVGTLRISSATIATQMPPRSPTALFSIALKPAGRLAGTVIREDGRSPDGVVIQVESAGMTSTTAADRVTSPAGPIHVGTDGRFRLEGDLLDGLRYRVTARSPGLDAACTEWITPAGPGKTATIPPLTLKNLRAVSGVVVDRQGRVIAGAEIIQAGDGPERTTTKTEASGRFRLGGFRSGPALISAHADGFRINGRVVADGENAIVLTRTTERPEKSMSLLPPPIPRDELLRIARTTPFLRLEAAFKASNHNDQFRAIDSLCALDLVEGLRLMRSSGYRPRQNLPGKIAIRFVRRGDLAGAEAAIGECDDPDYRARAMVNVADALDADRVEDKLRLLRQAHALLGEIPAPSNQVWMIGEIGERLLELGRGAEARAMFNSGRGIAETLAPTVSARASFASRMAGVDLPAALKLIEAIPNPEARSSAIGDAATRLAANRPEECERILRDYHVTAPFQVLDRMAAVEPARALRLAAVKENVRWNAMMRLVVAHGLARRDRDAAVHLCQEVMAELATVPSDSFGAALMDAVEAALVRGRSTPRWSPNTCGPRFPSGTPISCRDRSTRRTPTPVALPRSSASTTARSPRRCWPGPRRGSASSGSGETPDLLDQRDVGLRPRGPSPGAVPLRGDLWDG